MRFSKLNRTSAKTASESAYTLESRNTQPEEMQLLAGDLLNGGMVTSIHSHKLQDNQCVLSQGFRIRFDGLERRYGHDILTPVKPDSSRILLYNAFKRHDKTVKIYRFTKSSVNLYSSGAWINITGTALTGNDTDRFQALGVLDRLFFANNGADALQEIDLTANTYAAAGNSKKYKYYTSIYNRIVGANLAGSNPNPIEVGWCGDLNFTQWDPNIDISAGRNDLLEAGGGAGDQITGIFNIDNLLLIPREQSIWYAELSPVASFPFNFKQLVPEIGAGVPYAISKIQGGIAWFDRRLQNVFAYTLDSKLPVPIGDPIKKNISVDDINNVFSAFDPTNNEYILGIIQTSTTTVPLWIFNFNTNSWVYDEMENVSGVWHLSHSRSSKTIGELVGTIGDLVGTIGGLSTNQSLTTQFIGKSNGDILIQDATKVKEGGVAFTSIIESKDYKLPAVDMYIAQLKLIYIPITAGDLSVSYSIDGGVSYVAYKTINYASSSSDKQVLVKFAKHINCRQFRWKVETTTGRCKIVEYEIHVFPGSSSRGE